MTGGGMPDLLIHVHRKGEPPFRTLSALPDEQAVSIMKSLFIKGSVFWDRFGDPRGYLRRRREVEWNLRVGFISQGGRPVDDHPVYLILGRPKWIDQVADEATLSTTEMVEIPLSVIPPGAVSFTYPDSMASAMIAERYPQQYDAKIHGRVFTLAGMRRIISRKGMPGEGWEAVLPPHEPHYIEAQVWDRRPLEPFARAAETPAT